MNHTSTNPTAPASPTATGGHPPEAAGGGGDGVFRLETLAPGVQNAEQALGGLTAPNKRRVSTQIVALAALLGIGGGLIYGMRLLGIGPLTSIAMTTVPDYDLSKPNTRSADHQKILRDLATDHTVSQVPADEIQKNPFRMSDVVAQAPTPQADPDAAVRAAEERARREADAKRAKLQATLAELRINGIIGGSRPLARISGQAVRVGDVVAEIFTVKAIHGRSVELQNEGVTFELSMDDEVSGKAKKK
jgi:hypothetical protein